jgi:hypothetical protein
MGEQQHTPGPWKADGCDVTGPATTIAIALNKYDVGRANARLIAAAPDMLEALRPFAEWARQYELSTAGDIRDEVMLQSLRRARDAVAKATGAQP